MGIEQAALIASHVNHLDPRPLRLVVTGLSRADRTGAIINEKLSLPVETHPSLQEQHYGDHQGEHKDEIRARYGPHWFLNPVNGEVFADFQARVTAGLQSVLSAGGGLPLIVGHGGMITALGRHYGADLRGTKNCALYFFDGSAPAAAMPWTLYSLDLCETGLQRRAVMPGPCDF